MLYLNWFFVGIRKHKIEQSKPYGGWSMITGELMNKVDTIWTGGITSPITVLEQITYLLFMKLLDDNQPQHIYQVQC